MTRANSCFRAVQKYAVLNGWTVTRATLAGVAVLMCTRDRRLCLIRLEGATSERQQKALWRIEASGVAVHAVASADEARALMDPDRTQRVYVYAHQVKPSIIRGC